MKIKYMAILLILLCFLIGAASAADDGTVDSLDAAQDDAVSIDAVEESDEVASTEPTSTQTDEKLEQSNDKILKTGTKTVEVNNFTELQDTMNTATNDADSDEYVINLNSGTYNSQGPVTFAKGTYTPKITINGNGQSITGASVLTFEMGCQITINNLTIGKYMMNSNNNIILKDVILNGLFTNKESLTTINSTINYQITNNRNLNIINSTIKGTINTDGNLTIDDNTLFGNNFKIAETEGSQIHYGDMNKLLPYFSSFAGEYTFKDMDINLVSKTNYGTLYLINSTASSTSISQFINQGNVFIINSTCNIVIQHKKGNITVVNSTLGNKITLADPAILNIDDDSKFNSNLQIDNTKGTLITTNSNINDYLSYIVGNYTYNNCIFTNSFPKTFVGNIILINCTISSTKSNGVVITTRGNLTIINSTFLSGALGNYGNLTVDNITMDKGKIGNYGKIIFVNKSIITSIDNQNQAVIVMPIDEGKEVDEVYGPNLKIANKKGIIETNNLSKIFPYITGGFYQEGSVVLGNYNNVIQDYGILTIENSTLTGNVNIYEGSTLILKNTTVSSTISNSGTLYLLNTTIDCTLYNTKTSSILTISDDTQFGENFKFYAGSGEVITNNTEKFFDYVNEYYKDVVLTNKTINTPKTNNANLYLNNCTINSTIKNYGCIIIDEETVFGGNAEITGSGDIVINDISRVLPYISIIKGSNIISNQKINKTYTFYGTNTLNNCTITSLDNVNYGSLILNNCTIDVGENNTFLTNLQTVHVSKDTTINGKINDLSNGVEYEGEPQNIPKTYIITQDSIKYFIDSAGLNSVINPGDTLDIRGKIILNSSLVINKPVNIISSTKDGYIDLNTTAGDYFGSYQGNSFTIYPGASYSNITGIYFHNTQLWIVSTHYVTFDNISVVVENQRIGSGVGVTSIRQGSSHITVKNSYFHTTENEGSSTLVLAYANYCTIENNTIEGDGFVGNLLYITTYNVDIPDGVVFNSHNKLINNRLRGPERVTPTCYGICISGYDNLVDNNTIYSKGPGIMFQWGSGVSGIEQDECLFGSGENVVSNNKLYGGCGIEAGNIIYNNYMEGKLSVTNAKAYSNTANGLYVGENAEITNNNISGKVTFSDSTENSIISNNNIIGSIEIPTTAINNVLSDNNITGSVTLDGSFNNLTNNRIITTNNYAVSSNKLGQNNNLTGNYLVANGKVGNDAVSLRDESNVVASAGVATKVEVSVPGEVTVNKTVQVTIKLTDANGNPLDGQVTVSSALGSETVNITKGTGVYQYTPKAIGEDTISVKFAGNDTFYLSSNSAKVKVVAEKAPAQQNETKTPTKTPTKTVVSLSFVKAPKKVSKKAKKLIISAKLKVNGKLAKGKKLTFKFKGKTFKVKTNKKGVAKLTIKSKVLKKLLKKVKAGKKVKYQVSYGKKTVKKTLKVKK